MQLLPLGMPARQHHTVPSLERVSIAAVGLITAVVCLYSVRQADPDLFGYLSYGRMFVEKGAVLFPDPFAYTSSGHTWVTFEYGGHIALWWAYAHGGATGLIILKMILGGIALAFLFDALRVGSVDGRIWLPVFLLCASAVTRYCLFRPQLFTFAFFALFVSVLVRFLNRRPAPLWLLPLVTLVWANTHGGFVAGLGAVGLALLLTLSELAGTRGNSLHDLQRRLLTLVAVLAASTAATLATPLGIRLWKYVAMELLHDTNRQYIREWAPATLSNDPWSTVLLSLLAFFVAFLAIANGVDSVRRPSETGPAPLARALSCVPLIAMAFLSVRHVPLAALWTGPILVQLGGRIQTTLSERGTYRRMWFILRGLALVPACLTFAVVYHDPRPVIRATGYGLGRTNPCRAVQFLQDSGASGRIFVPLWWGSYVSWKLYPQLLVSMDGRNVSLFPDSLVVENLRFYTAPVAPDVGVPIDLGSDFLIVPDDSAALRATLADTRWHAVYGDEDATVFARSEGVQRSRGDSAGATHSQDCQIGL